MEYIAFITHAWRHYLDWQSTDKKMVKKINELVQNAMREPFLGLGKPEPLKGELTGYWSRRITDKHRLVYRCEKGILYIVSCRGHY